MNEIECDLSMCRVRAARIGGRAPECGSIPVKILHSPPGVLPGVAPANYT